MTDEPRMTLFHASRYSSRHAGNRPTIWDLAVPALVVESSWRCGEVDEILRAGPSGEHTSLVVHDPSTGRVGFVSCRRFELQMSGRYGFGRALLGRSPIERLTDWETTVLSETATLAAAVDAVLSRPAVNRYDDLLMRGSGQWRRLAAGAVLEELAANMARRASLDELTGLANRTAFFEHLEVLSTGAQNGASVAVIFIDLDRMKAVNDSLGHPVGDALLISVARRLVAAADRGEVVARLGGDEFAVALTLPEQEGPAVTVALTRLAERYLAAVRNPDPGLDPRAASTASIGAAAAHGTAVAVGPQTLLREADVAMYQAKQAGGDRVVVAQRRSDTPEPGTPPMAARSLPAAMANGELELVYQPIVEVRSGRITSVEALIRWHHPKLGLLGPDRILATAEAEQALTAMDMWVLRTALKQLLTWSSRLGERAPAGVNVNLTNASVGDPRLSSNVLAILADHGCPPERLRLELPETASLSLAASAAGELATLAESGVLLALDDMGAGASSLRHLSAFEVTEMKIDRSFVDRMLTDVRDRAVVEMLINLAGGLDLWVTAEGVETSGQLIALRALGIDYVQGHLLGKPASAQATERMLAAHPGNPAYPSAAGSSRQR